MRRFVGATLILIALSGCSSQSESASQAATVDRDTLTRRQKDSITATLPIPQGRAVGKALGAADAAANRAADIDAQQGR
jgi:hypothetical protein